MILTTSSINMENSTKPQTVTKFLEYSRLEQYQTQVKDLIGSDVVEDLQDLTEEDLRNINMSPVQIRRFLRYQLHMKLSFIQAIRDNRMYMFRICVELDHINSRMTLTIVIMTSSRARRPRVRRRVRYNF